MSIQIPSPTDLDNEIKAQIPFESEVESELALIVAEIRRLYHGRALPFIPAASKHYLVCCEVARRLRSRGWSVEVKSGPWGLEPLKDAAFAFQIEP